MAESPTQSLQPQTPPPENEIPTEIVSHGEMAVIEAALAATRSALSSSSSPSSISKTLFHRNARSVKSITVLSKRKLSGCSSIGDIEDSGLASVTSSPTKKMTQLTRSLLHRFRRKRGLSVTDITGTEWCERQMELSLILGKPEKTEAMKLGVARHAALEEEEILTLRQLDSMLLLPQGALNTPEMIMFCAYDHKVVKRTQVKLKTKEDEWALKFLNYIVGVNQLVSHGLTRELPLIGLVEGVWIIGVVDEIRMPVTELERCPVLVDIKTRVQPIPPAEPQQRNGRLQLMCYKLLWDTLVASKFPSGRFFDFFSLNPNAILSAEIRKYTGKSGYPAGTLSDMVRHYTNTCFTLPRAHDQLILRYELQKDKSLLGECEFAHDPDWLHDQIKYCLEFWKGDRQARYTPEEERWKCWFCRFKSVCPATKESDGTKS